MMGLTEMEFYILHKLLCISDKQTSLNSMLTQNEPSLVALNRPVRPFLRVGGSWPK